MGKRCVVANCSSTHKDGVSLFRFPKDSSLKAIWNRQIKRTRKDWHSPSEYSCVCSKHFTEDSFQSSSVVSGKLGLKRKQLLKDGAIPTIFPSSAAVMRQPVSMTTRCQSTRCRPAYEKREQTRIVSECLERIMTAEVNTSSVSEVDSDITSSDSIFEDYNTCSKETQTETLKFIKDVCTQTTLQKQISHKRIQVEPITHDIGIQCNMDLEKHDMECQCDIQSHDIGVVYEDEECNNSLSEDSMEYEEMDVSYEKEATPDDTSDDEDEDYDNKDDNPINQKKFIVFAANLLPLFLNCFACHSPAEVTTDTIGTFLRVKALCCSCSFHFTWDSQPFVNDMPAGNLSLSTSIICSGSLPSKVIKLLKFMNCVTFSESTYFKYQRKYLNPAISTTWKKHQNELSAFLESKKKPLTLGGDGRCDSPGYCAKFGTYTLLELEYNLIVDIQLVQSNEVSSSSRMEKEGLVRGIEYITDENLDIGCLITDRHSEITKWVRENMTDTLHKYDMWHVAKGLKKKLEKLSKSKDCELVKEWSRSIINHLYWSVTSSNGRTKEIKEKWLSVTNHIHNKHTGHGTIYKKCPHRQIRRKWFEYGTKVSDTLLSILNNNYLLKSICNSSHTYQTSQLEAFHSLILHYAPKHTAFSYEGMQSRLQLAALHYNFNSDRQQATTEEGKERFSIAYPKYKKGGHIVRKIKTKSMYDYVNIISGAVYEAATEDITVEQLPIPPPLNNNYYKPNKEDAVLQHKSRFINKST